MMQEQVIITPLRINVAGQVKHFQIKLPQTAKRIVGVELGGRLLTDNKATIATQVSNSSPSIPQVVVATTIIKGHTSSLRPIAFKRNELWGELKLQSCEEANIFYAGQLQTDNTMSYLDFSQNQFWRMNPFTHQAMAFEEVVIVDAQSTIIQGVYKDRLADQRETMSNYLVNVYLWYQK
jgi:hypothetical protein